MVHNTGTVINKRYRIVRLLGQGGFGAVYRAWDMSLQKPCALKENLNLTLQGQRQFKHEAMMLAKLAHPNLPRVTDHFSLPGQGQYLVMDFIDGEDLENRMQRQGVVPEKQAIEWVSQVANVLTYLHNQPSPVIHRDIKPANIRLAPDGRAVLVDFGLVKIHNPKLRTTVGARAVTPGYSPPEQYGHGQTDARTDIYALGATLYKLLTGQDPQESVQRLGQDTMPPAHQVNPQVTSEIGQIVQRAMNLDPMQRYQTAADFKDALKAPRFAPTLPVIPRQNPRQVPPVNPNPAPMPPVNPNPSPIPPVNPNPSSLPPTTFLTNQSNSTTGRNLKPLYWLMGIGLVVIMGMAGIWMFRAQQEANQLAIANAQATTIAEVHATGTIQTQKTATANAQQMATAEAQQTATAEVVGTSTARAEKTATAQAVATKTARAQETVIAQVLATRTARAQNTAIAQARANFVSTVEASQREQFGPEDGSLPHANDNLVETDSSQVKLRNFVVEARFFNPYSPSSGSWDYGYLFRRAENKEFRLIIDSEKNWFLYYRFIDEDNLISSGLIPNLDISTNGSNRVKLICQENRGLLYINGELITELDLSAQKNSGDVLIATGIYNGYQIDGYATDYQDFTVWSIP